MYLGNQPALNYTSFAKQDFSTSATTSYTLDNPVANANELALFINFVRQEPTTSYSASGTTLTLTEATSSSDDMYCVYLGKAVQTVNPPNASVGTSQLVDGSVTSAKLDSGVALGKILQVVHTKLETGVSANNSLVASGLIASITPSSTSSKILIMTTVGGIRNTSGVWFQFYVYRQINGGGYSNFDQLEGGLLYNSSTITTNMARNIMDTTHNTTNQIDYQIYFQPTNGVGSINVDGLESSTITLMEVSG